MASRALLGRCLNQLANSNKSFKYISNSAALCEGNKIDISTAVEIYEPPSKTPNDFLTPDEKKAHDARMSKLITIESDENYVGPVSGVPDEHIKTRTVCIYRPSKNAMQSGTSNINHWQISFDTRGRWENPLMGWCSSGDPLQSTRVNFKTEEEAIEHCKRMGWNYFIQKPNRDDPPPRSYGTNFSWNKRSRVTTK